MDIFSPTIIDNAIITGSNNASLLQVSSPSAASAFFISGSGRVGIGTTSPLSTLTVEGGNINIGAGRGIGGNFVGTYTSFITYHSDGLGFLQSASFGFRGSAYMDSIAYPDLFGFGTNDLRFFTSTNGIAAPSEIMRMVGSTGFVGIGETSPSAKLEIRGSGATSATTALRVENSSAVARLTILDNGTSAFNTSHLYVSGSGRVGIGTATPIAQLHVTNSMLVNGTSDYFGGIDTTVPIQMFAGVANNGIGFRTDNFYLYPYGNNTSLIYGWNGNAAWTLRNLNTSSFQIFNNSPTNAVMLTVSSSGNVGIGTATPVHNLVVDGNTGVSINAGGATFPNIHRDSADGGMLLRSWNGSTFTNNVKITPTTEVGIGTTTPTAELHISGASNITLLRVGSPAQANILFITGSGNIGVGTTTPGVTLDVVGQIRASSTMFNSTTQTNTIQLSSATNLQFLSASVETARYDNTGWGFFNTTPTARVHISGANTDNLFRISSPSATNALFVSGSGNVGIGTNLPSAELHISGASIDSLLRVGSPTQANTLFITGSNRVGIGTGTPRALFEVNDKIIAEAGGNVGIQTTADYWIHLSTDPGGGKHLNIDAAQSGNPPADYTPSGGNTVNKVVGNISDSNILGTPDYWMEIRLGGTTVLIPCYTPTP